MSLSTLSVGTFRRKLQITSTPSTPSSCGRAPDPPTSGCSTLTRVPPVLRSGTDTSRIDAWPLPNDGTWSGTAWARAPTFTSVMRTIFAERFPHATPKTGFSNVPDGTWTLNGRTIPALYVMSGSIVHSQWISPTIRFQCPFLENVYIFNDARTCGSVPV